MSIAELLVTMGIVGILLVVTLAGISHARRGRDQAVCATNLQAIDTAFAYYIADFHECYPAPTPTAQWEDLLRNYVHRTTFHCPADFELFDALGSSYDWRDTGDPMTTLAGKSVMQVTRSDVSIAFDTLPGWHAPGKIQVLKSDHAVYLIDQTAFFDEFQRSPTQ